MLSNFYFMAHAAQPDAPAAQPARARYQNLLDSDQRALRDGLLPENLPERLSLLERGIAAVLYANTTPGIVAYDASVMRCAAELNFRRGMGVADRINADERRTGSNLEIGRLDVHSDPEVRNEVNANEQIKEMNREMGRLHVHVHSVPEVRDAVAAGITAKTCNQQAALLDFQLDPANAAKLQRLAEQNAQRMLAAEQALEAARQQNRLANIQAWGNIIQNSIGQVGNGLNAFVHDRAALANLGLAVAGTYCLYKGSQIAFNQLDKYLNRPNIISKSNAPNVKDMIVAAAKGLIYQAQRPFPMINDVVLDKQTKSHLMQIGHDIHNIKKNGGFLRNYLFWGCSGTGKTMFAEALANEVDCYYVYIKGPKFLELGRKGMAEIEKLFKWMHNQRKKVILIIDEAESIFRQRDKTMDADQRTIIEQLISYTGTESDRFMMIALSNRPEEFDEANLTRFAEVVEFKLPNLEQRKAIIEKNIHRQLTLNKVDTTIITDTLAHNIALDTKGLCGRDLMYFASTLKSLIDRTKERVVTLQIITEAVNQSLQNAQHKKNGFQRAGQAES